MTKTVIRLLGCTLRAFSAALALCAVPGGAWAQELNPALREQVLMIVKKACFQSRWKPRSIGRRGKARFRWS